MTLNANSGLIRSGWQSIKAYRRTGFMKLKSLFLRIKLYYWRNIMNSITNTKEIEYIAVRTWTEKRMIFIELTDGRIIGFPADRFKILKKATDKKLKEVKLALN